jgi:uncharacterized protein (DUF305 family)
VKGMGGRSLADAWVDWRAAMLLGLVSSTFSTLVSTLAAQRLGRDAVVDWMVVAAIPAREAALSVHPEPWADVVGILFHQWADFSWAVVFFGLLGRWTARRSPGWIALTALPWSIATSASEWLFLVPWLPFRQPMFTLEQPYWLGFVVHLFSALIYPLFPGLRDRVAKVRPSPHRRFTAAWSGGAAAVLAGLGVLAVMGAADREPTWRGRDPAFDQAFMRRMAAHHAQGVEVATLAARRAKDPHLRALASLMAASQTGEIKVLRAWWRSWFPTSLPPASSAECLTMPGMLSAAQLASLRSAHGSDFDRLFVELMTRHHLGAVAMADNALAEPGDLRVRAMAHAIRHAQTGEIALMHGAGPGPASVEIALRSLLAPPGQGGEVAQEAALADRDPSARR